MHNIGAITAVMAVRADALLKVTHYKAELTGVRNRSQINTDDNIVL